MTEHMLFIVNMEAPVYTYFIIDKKFKFIVGLFRDHRVYLDCF